MTIQYATTQVLMPAIKTILDEGNQVKITVTGNSMLPLIRHELDQVTLSAFDGLLKMDDIILIRRLDGDYVLHRVIRIDEVANQFYMVGDAQKVVEGPLDFEQIIARVIGIERGFLRFDADYSLYRFYVWLWRKLFRYRLRILRLMRLLRMIP